MDESYIISVSGDSSVLEASFYPPIELNSSKQYVIGFVDLWTFNSIPNIFEGCNKIRFVSGEKKEQTITIPTGNYELEHLASELETRCAKHGIDFSLKSNENTLKTIIRSNWQIDFRKDQVNTIRDLLGFKPDLYSANKDHEAENIVNIISLNSIAVKCSIAIGSYHNGQLVRTLHEFFPDVPNTYKIIESPSQVIYLPITVEKSIDYIQFRLVDQKGNLVDFRGEEISLRVHIKVVV